MLMDIKCNFLLVFSDESKSGRTRSEICKHVKRARFVSRSMASPDDGKDNPNRPHIIVADSSDLEDGNYELARYLVTNKTFRNSAIIFVGSIPEQQIFLGELEAGKVQFVNDTADEEAFSRCLNNALYFVKSHDDSLINLKLLPAGKQLIRHGDNAKFIYLVNAGELEASITREGKKVILGGIKPDEFVGEMAYFNNEPHSADVYAITDCELVEMPIDMVDELLLRDPSMTRALMQTLTRRIKKANRMRNN